MFAKPIEALISKAGATAITEAFIIVMLAAFIYAIYAKRMDKAHNFSNYTPTLLTSLGILGTFCGIVAGLLGFDIANIDGSIDKLLLGMKTAFTTSLVGMGLSILFKALSSIEAISPKHQTELDVQDIGIAELYKVMVEQGKSLSEQNKLISVSHQMMAEQQKTFVEHGQSLAAQAKAQEQQSEAAQAQTTLLNQQHDGLLGLQSAIAGEHQSSLNGQLQALRLESKENIAHAQKDAKLQHQIFQKFQQDLWQQLKSFSEMMSQTAAEQLVKVQQQVIQDFNNKLNDQFGDNFKELNTAVVEMVHWQENYRGQMLEMRENYAQGVSAISQTENSLVNISDHTQHIASNMNNWQQVMEVNQHQIQELNRHLETFAELRDKAVDASPQIQHHIEQTLSSISSASEKLSQGVESSATQLQQAINSSAEKLSQSGSDLHDQFDEHSKSLSASSAAFTKHLAEGADDFRDGAKTLQESIVESSKSLHTSVSDSSSALQSSIEESAKSLHTSVGESSTALQSSIQESTKSLHTSVGDSSNTLQESISDSASALLRNSEALVKQLQQGSETIDSATQESHQALLDSAKLLNDSTVETKKLLQENNKELDEHFKKLGKDIGLESQEFGEQIRESGTALMRAAGRSREAFDNDMQSMVEQVTESLQTMTAQQTEESLKIVQLHIKLTQDLQRILTLSN